MDSAVRSPAGAWRSSLRSGPELPGDRRGRTRVTSLSQLTPSPLSVARPSGAKRAPKLLSTGPFSQRRTAVPRQAISGGAEAFDIPGDGNTPAASSAPGDVSLGPRPDLSLARQSVSSRGTSSGGASPNPPNFNEELQKLLDLLPTDVAHRLQAHPDLPLLVEVVLDLGRLPMARFPQGDWMVSDTPVSAADLEQTVSKVGQFGGDNRAGVDRTLHRISAIRNRASKVVGLTCRVGRAIAGGAEIVRDLVSQGGSLLLMGPPGVGKTTAIRDVARMLADEYNRRVVVVDTSNEIGGDGDVPHPGIGRARRMQVPHVDRQHEVMIEAVENHMPQTIVIDEIGTELEAAAACTISQRGVQLVGTAHGMTVDNLIKNPSLQELAGGIQSVTLGDEEARRRGVQKSVLERKGPPVFECAVEMLSRTTWRVHHNLGATVDAILAGKTPAVEIRTLTPTGQVARTGANPLRLGANGSPILPPEMELAHPSAAASAGLRADAAALSDDDEDSDSDSEFDLGGGGLFSSDRRRPLTLYLYQVSSDNLEQVLEVMGVLDTVTVTDDVASADAVLALRSKLKHNSWLRGMAKFRQLPIYAIKSNTMPQMVRAMRAILGFDSFGPGLKAKWVTAPADNADVTFVNLPAGAAPDSLAGLASLAGSTPAEPAGMERERGPGGAAPPSGPKDDAWVAVGSKALLEDEIDALEEARLAVEQIVLPLRSPVELLPRAPHVLDLQTKLLGSYCLTAERVGTHPSCRIRILPAGSSSAPAEPTNSADVATLGEVSPASSGGVLMAALPLAPLDSIEGTLGLSGEGGSLDGVPQASGRSPELAGADVPEGWAGIGPQESMGIGGVAGRDDVSGAAGLGDLGVAMRRALSFQRGVQAVAAAGKAKQQQASMASHGSRSSREGREDEPEAQAPGVIPGQGSPGIALQRLPLIEDK